MGIRGGDKEEKMDGTMQGTFFGPAVTENGGQCRIGRDFTNGRFILLVSAWHVLL